VFVWGWGVCVWGPPPPLLCLLFLGAAFVLLHLYVDMTPKGS